MHTCRLCHKKVKNDSEMFFKIPREARKRKKWNDVCGIELSTSDGLCGDHFSSTDIIKQSRKISLAPDAVPLPLHDVKSSGVVDLNNCCPEYIHINTLHDKSDEKCLCCTNPSSSNFLELDSCVKSRDGLQKTYKDLLYEIINISIPIQHENNLPQQICLKCGTQLKNSYKFIQQASQVYQQYLKLIDQQTIQYDIKNIEHLQESLIEYEEGSVYEHSSDDLKGESLNEQYDMDIKDEKAKWALFPPNILANEYSQEERDFLQNSDANDDSTEYDEDSDEPASVNCIEKDLNNVQIAMSCDICHKVYRNEKFLKIHKRYTHMPEENKMPCPLCSYKASRTSALKVHIGLVHGQDKVKEYFKPLQNSNKKYPCNFCPNSYGRKDSLRKHARRKHLNKAFKDEVPKKSKPPKPKEKQCFLCTYCGQAFNTKSGLKSHALTHTGERPFSCEICNKTFKRIKDLQLHRVIHSDEKPHQCSECGKAFKRADKLKIHMRVHSQLRPYKCTECEKTFKYLNVLRTHMHIHTGQKPFSCKTCGETFSLRTSLNYHCLKNDHRK